MHLHPDHQPCDVCRGWSAVRELADLYRQSKEEIMTSIANLQASIDALTNVAAASKGALDDLAGKIAILEPGEISQEQIDELQGKVDAASNLLSGAISTDDPNPTPPADVPVDDSTPPVTETPAQ